MINLILNIFNNKKTKNNKKHLKHTQRVENLYFCRVCVSPCQHKIICGRGLVFVTNLKAICICGLCFLHFTLPHFGSFYCEFFLLFILNCN